MENIEKNQEIEKQQKIKSSKSMVNLTVRKDYYGNVISKKYKTHKISFIDRVDRTKKPIAEVILVQSYRNANREGKINSESGYDGDAWNCNIF